MLSDAGTIFLGVIGLAYMLLVLGLLVLGLVVLIGFHKKNKTEIRVIRKRLGLGENGKDGASS